MILDINALSSNFFERGKIMAKFIEELSMNAWPSLQTHLYDGWVLRVSNGYTKRANSVNPLYSANINLDEKINYCKEFYTNLGLPVIYKITSNSDLTIDKRLSELGYEKLDETSVQILDLSQLEAKTHYETEVKNQISQEWIDGFISSSNIEDETKKETLRSMLNNITSKTIFAIHKFNGKAVAFGYGVVDSGYVGLFDILVNQKFRGNGYSKSVVNAILSEAKQLGAKKAYLQVVKGNTPAENLYKKFGFKESYSYWYRKL